MAEGILWKQADNHFVVQFNNVEPRDRKLIKEKFSDWKWTGHGTQRDGQEVFLYSNNNQNEKQIIAAVKSLPFPFVQENIKNGKIKKIKTCYDSVKTKKEPVGLTNSRTCDKIRKISTCSKCGNTGHNSRRCNVVSQ